MRQPCFACNQPAQMILNVMDISKARSEVIGVCDICHTCLFRGDDEAAGWYFFALQEAHSKGYTDAGFVQELLKNVKKLGYELCLGWSIDPTNEKAEVAFLFIVIENIQRGNVPMALWCRSNKPISQGLIEAADYLPTFQIPYGVLWDDTKRCFVGSYAVGEEVTPLDNASLSTAILKREERNLGTLDVFQKIMAGGGNAGYEIIRRFLLKG